MKVGTAVRIGVYAVACPTCKVEPGTMCKGGKGHPKRTVAPHAPRLAQSRAKEVLERPAKVERLHRGSDLVRGMGECTCGHPAEAHGWDPNYPAATDCTECDCIAFDASK